MGAILVFLWFAGEAQASGLVPWTLDLWAMDHSVVFLLSLLLWEVLFVGIPVMLAVVAVILLWWRKLPRVEREEYRRANLFSGRNSRRSEGQGAITFVVFIAFVIKIYLDGNWGLPFAEWTFEYLVYSYILSLVAVPVIIGIPMALGGTWWIGQKSRGGTLVARGERDRILTGGIPSHSSPSDFVVHHGNGILLMEYDRRGRIRYISA